MKIVATILTVDRSPRANFLANTVASLRASGLLHHPAFSLHIFHSGENANINDANLEDGNITLHTAPDRRHFNLGLVNALRHASSLNPDFVLFMEDDIEVCPDFPDYVISTLAEFSADPLMDFVTYYEEVMNRYLDGERCIDMPADSFYGTQCFAMTRENALSYADFVERNHQVKPGFADVWFDSWLEDCDRPRTVSCAVPSAAQHTGVESTHSHEFVKTPAYKSDLEQLTPRHTGDYLLLDTKDANSTLRHKVTGAHLELNESAYLIYLYCDGEQSIGQIIDGIHAEIEIDRTLLSAHIRQGLASLRHNRVIDI